MKKTVAMAFTLAEVLITIGIIGIVAAMTIPDLVNKVQDIQFRSAYKKVFSDLSNASKQWAGDNGADLYGVIVGAGVYQILENLRPYLKVEKFCDQSTLSSLGNCWHNDQQWSNYIGTKLTFSDLWVGGAGCTSTSPYCKGMILTNGTLIQMYNPSGVGSSFDYGGYFFAKILVDVNGFQGPNVIGRDIQGITVASKVSPAVSTSQYSFVPGLTFNPTPTYCTTGTLNLMGVNCGKMIIAGQDY